MTLPTRPHAIFSTLQGTQNPDTKPTLQRAKNANAQPTAPRRTNIYHHLFDTSATNHYWTPKPTHHPTRRHFTQPNIHTPIK
jgi:glutaredoxin 2